MDKKIHFFRYDSGSYHEFSLIHYISIVSFLENCKEAKVLFWTNDDKPNIWIELIKSKYRMNRFEVHITDFDYKEIKSDYHRVDYTKLVTLLHQGGMIVDSDMIALKPLPIDFNKVNLLEESDPVSFKFAQLCIGMVVAPYMSDFIREWIDSYKNYTDKSNWTEFSGVVPTNIWKSGKYKDVTILDHRMYDPVSYIRKDVNDLFLHNKSIADNSVTIHVSESITWDRFLKPLDIEHIMTVDTTFTRLVRRYVEDLWDPITRSSKIQER